jgi:hypothetical protein
MIQLKFNGFMSGQKCMGPVDEYQTEEACFVLDLRRVRTE